MTFATDWDKLVREGATPAYRVKVEIYLADADPVWHDINAIKKRHPLDKWIRRLKVPPARVAVGSEKAGGRFTVSSSQIVLDNSDGIFGESLPWTFYDDNGDAVTLDTWYRVKLRLSIRSEVSGGGSQVLGVVRIEDIKRTKDKTAIMEVVGLERTLMDAKAKDCREGDTWFTNVKVPQLVEELIRRAGKGEIEFESGSPGGSFVDNLPIGSTYYGTAGNFPAAETRGDWYRKREFVPRYQRSFDSRESVIYAGYNARTNTPAILKWTQAIVGETGEQWEYWTAPEEVQGYSVLGWEAIYVIPGSGGTDWLFFCVTNEADSPAAFPNLGHRMMVLGLEESPVAWSRHARRKTVPMGVFPLYETSGRSVPGSMALWGNYVWTAFGAPPGLPMLFPSRASAPHAYMNGSDLMTAGLENSETGIWEPYTMADIASAAPGGEDAYHTIVKPLPTGVYCCKLLTGEGLYYYFPLRHWLHTDISKSFCYWPDRDRVYWIEYDEGEYQLASILSDGSSADTQVIEFPERPNGVGSGHLWNWLNNQITAFTVGGASGQTAYAWFAVNCGAQCPDRPGGYDPERWPDPDSNLYRWELPASDPLTEANCTEINWGTNLTPDFGKRFFPMLLSIHYNPDNLSVYRPLHGQFVNYWAPSTHTYGFWYHYSLGTYGLYKDMYADGRYPQSPMPFMESEPGQGFGSLWVADQATGALTEIIPSTTQITAVTRVWEPIDGENVWQCCNLLPLLRSLETLIVGVSMTTPPADCREEIHHRAQGQWNADLPRWTGAGRISVWSYGRWLTDAIPIADFGDANVWDALEMCRQAVGDKVMGFNADGDFYFKKRSPGSTIYRVRRRGDTPYPFAGQHGGTTVYAESIHSHMDHRDIVNSITVPSYLGRVESPEYTPILTEDSTADAIGVNVQQTTLRAMKIILRCISPGVPPMPDDTDSEKTPLLFSFHIVHDEMETALSTMHPPTAPMIYVYGMSPPRGEAGPTYVHMRLGDRTVSAGDFVSVGDGVAQKIVRFVGENRIDLEGNIGGSADHPRGTPVIITPQAKLRGSDSPEGICLKDEDQAYAVDDIIPAFLVDSTARIRPGMVLFAEDSCYFHVLDVVDSTTLAVKASVLGGGLGMNNGTVPDGARLSAAIWVDQQGRSYAIGSTGVSFGLSTKGQTSGKEGAYAVGDQIVITCFGLGVAELKANIYSSSNALSIDTYGKKEWRPRVKNRLITPGRASHLMTTLAHLLSPQHNTRVDGLPLLFNFTPEYNIGVYDSYLWPDETVDGVNHVTEQVIWNLASGTMSVRMRSRMTGPRGRGIEVVVPVIPAYGVDVDERRRT